MTDIKKGDILLVRSRRMNPNFFFVDRVKSVGNHKIMVKIFQLDKSSFGVDFWLYNSIEEAEIACDKINNEARRYRSAMRDMLISFEDSITRITEGN